MATALSVFALLLLVHVWSTHRVLLRATRGRRPAPARTGYPSLTVVRPIRGLDAGARENLRAALDHGYPGEVETLFVLDDADEPILPLLREAIAEHEAAGRPDDARILFCGQPPPQRTGKLNAMITGLREARGSLVAFADSDIRPDRNTLRTLVDALLGSPQAGAAFAPVVSSSPTRTIGDAGYALLLNGLYGPNVARMAERRGGELPFIMGQLMVLRRQAIEAIGGLEAAQGQIVDDMYLGQRLHAAGYRNVTAPATVPIIQEGLGLWEFAGIYRRWIIFSSTGLPTWSFKLSAWLRASVFWAGVVLGSYAAWQGLWLAALLGWLVPVATTASINALHEAVGGAPLPLRHRWVAFALLLAGPAVLASIQSRRAVTWRGRRYDLNGRLSLAPPAPEATVDASGAPLSAVRGAPARVRAERSGDRWAVPEASRQATGQDESSPPPAVGPGRAGGREAA